MLSKCSNQAGMRKELNTQNTGSNPVPTTTIFCNNDKSGKLPADIPTNPNQTYKDKGWAGMGDWLGTGTIASSLRQYRTFNAARKFARTLKLKGQKEWRLFCKSGKLPADIPATPSQIYKDKGWKGMRDWLGTSADE